MFYWFQSRTKMNVKCVSHFEKWKLNKTLWGKKTVGHDNQTEASVRFIFVSYYSETNTELKCDHDEPVSEIFILLKFLQTWKVLINKTKQNKTKKREKKTQHWILTLSPGEKSYKRHLSCWSFYWWIFPTFHKHIIKRGRYYPSLPPEMFFRRLSLVKTHLTYCTISKTDNIYKIRKAT